MRLEIDPSEVKEIVDQATSGNWIPFGIIIACLGLCIFLFVVILKIKEGHFNSHNEKQDEALSELTKISSSMDKMLAVHDSEIKELRKVG